MPPFDNEVLVQLAYSTCQNLPPQFSIDIGDLATLPAPPKILELDEATHTWSNGSICQTILGELSLYLCTSDPKYDTLRSQGENATTALVAMLGGTVATKFAISSMTATACVAYVALAVVKLGVGVFCDRYPPPSGPTEPASRA